MRALLRSVARAAGRSLLVLPLLVACNPETPRGTRDDARAGVGDSRGPSSVDGAWIDAAQRADASPAADVRREADAGDADDAAGRTDAGLAADAAIEADTGGVQPGVDPTTPIAANLNQGSSNSLGELSGLVSSAVHPGFVWAHRDGLSTDPDSRVRLYAFKIVNRALVSFSGASGSYPTREFTFQGTGTTIKNNNWEDIAIGVNALTNSGSSLYIGDVGNNLGGRNLYQVYQFAEPDPTGAAPPISVENTWKFAYPAAAQLAAGKYPNCETLFFLDRYLYVVTKESQPRVYRFPDDYFVAPGTVHTLVPVTNGATSRVVGAGGNPSYGQFSAARDRFMLGGHAIFKVWVLGANGETGDALVRKMLLTPSRTPAFSKTIDPTPSAALNTEGGTWAQSSKDLIFGTESKMIYHWPQASYEQ